MKTIRADEWFDIRGYDGKYQVNYNGQIRRMYASGKTRLLKPFVKNENRHYKRYYVKLTYEGKTKMIKMITVVSETFLGKCPDGYIPIHKNGMQSDNCVANIEYIRKTDNGKINGAKSRRKPVVKIDSQGQVVCFYTSAREAARKNYMSYQTILDRCNGKVKSEYAPDGYKYKWDDKIKY